MHMMHTNHGIALDAADQPDDEQMTFLKELSWFDY